MISLIIPVYNREKYIEECIRSIQAQTYKNYEIILIDDGSTDNTLPLCQSLAEKDPAIRVLQSAHMGVSAARNIGLDAARGDFIFFIDSDDVIHPQLLEALVTGLKETDAAIAGTTIQCVSEANWHWVEAEIAQGLDTGETVYHNHNDTVHMTFHSLSPLSGIGGVMMRKDLIGETRFRTDLFLGEDVYFIYQNLIKGSAAVFLKQMWYYARFHEHNSSFNYSYSCFWSRFYHYKLIWESEEQLGRPENATRKKLAAFSWYMTCLKHGKPCSKESKKIRNAMKNHMNIFLPCLSTKERAHCWLSTYCPYLYHALMKIKGGFRKKRPNE